jgi:excisionase family DNA binding protein
VARTARSSQVANQLGISPATVQRYAREGLIPFTTTAGGHRRFDVQEVRAAMAVIDSTSTAGRDRERAADRRSCTAVILTALGVEMAAVLKYLPDPASRRLRGGTRYEVATRAGRHIDWTVYAAEIGEGNVGAATEATAAIHELEPDIVLFVGVAGSLKPDLPHGSVVVASRIYHYMSGKSADDFMARPVAFPTWHGLEQLVRTVRRSPWTDADPPPMVELRPIAAGERVVASKGSVDFRLLQQHYNDAVAIDMESLGLYLAAQRADHLPALAVRGISDMLSDKVPDADAHWQPIAARNAAAFAFALLDAVEPEDLPLGPQPALYPSQRAELLGTIPPPAATALERAMKRDPRAAFELLGVLSESDTSPAQIVANVIASSSPMAGASDSDLWVAVGEFAVAHGEHRSGAVAFHRAAAPGGPEAGRWLGRAALAYAAAGEMSKAATQLAEARSLTTGDSPFLDVIDGALAEDANRIVQAARRQRTFDPLVDTMVVTALHVTGALDQALEVARRSLERAPSRGLTGGLALAAARLLVERAQAGPASTIKTRDLHEAQELALLVRDLRRAWHGPSAEAAYLAAVAAFEAGDRDGALRIALPEPDGQATKEEAADPELVKVAANVAMALRQFDRARELAARISDPIDRLLVEVDCAIGEGTANDETAARVVSAVPSAKPAERFRAYLQLVELGVWPLPDLALLEDAEGAEIVLAEAELAQGKFEDAIRRLRALDTPRGRAFLIGAYHEAGQVPEAVEALRDGARRFGEPRYLLRAAALLAQQGDLKEAKSQAEQGLTMVPARSHLAGQLRALLIEVGSRLRDWELVVAHATAAVSDGFDTSEFRWALVWAHFYRRDREAALGAWRAGDLRPRNDDDAILITQVLRAANPDKETVTQLLELAEQFQGSEEVSAAAFNAVFEVSRNLKLPDDIVRRLRTLSEAFFERWPESPLLHRIDVSDLNTLVDYLRDSLASSAKQLDEMAQKVQLGELPYGMLAAYAGRSLAEALIKNGAGSIAAGQPDPELAAREDEVCAKAADKSVVADTAALVVASRTGLNPKAILAFFARVQTASVTLDDAFIAADALRLRSTSTMGWDPKRDRPLLTDVEPEQADAWAQEAEALLDRTRSTQVTSVRETASQRDLALEVMLAPVRLAKELGVPLWSDDRAMRILARNEGVDAFGIGSILRAMAAMGRIEDTQLADSFVSLMRHAVVDFPVPRELVLRLALEQKWQGGAAAIVLSRPSFWTSPDAALDVFKACVVEAAATEPNSLPQWSFAAGIGCARRLGHPRQCDTVAAVMLSGFGALSMEPRFLPLLLIGARSAAELLGCSDPLSRGADMLSTSMQKQFGEATGAQLFARAISELPSEDRTEAFRVLVQSS